MASSMLYWCAPVCFYIFCPWEENNVSILLFFSTYLSSAQDVTSTSDLPDNITIFIAKTKYISVVDLYFLFSFVIFLDSLPGQAQSKATQKGMRHRVDLNDESSLQLQNRAR